MTERDRMRALRENYAGEDGAVPASVLNDVFCDWVKGETDDGELVAHLLPLAEQPMLLRLQILAQAANLGQTLLQEVERRLQKEAEAVEISLAELDEAFEAEPEPRFELAHAALQLYTRALQTLHLNLAEPAPQLILDSLSIGQEASMRFNEACRQAS